MEDDAIYAARAELADFLVEVFLDVPSEEFVEHLLSGDVEMPADGVNEDLDRGFDHVREFVAENEDRDPETVADELTTEYTRVFVGPRPPVLAHETYYRDDTQFIGEGLAEVEASYGAAGWSPPEDAPEENDHAAVEMAFVRNLIARQRSGQEETFGYERVFLDEHLLRWVDDCAVDIRDNTDEPLYLAAASILAGFVEFEDELVAQMIPDSH